VKDNVSV